MATSLFIGAGIMLPVYITGYWLTRMIKPEGAGEFLFYSLLAYGFILLVGMGICIRYLMKKWSESG